MGVVLRGEEARSKEDLEVVGEACYPGIKSPKGRKGMRSTRDESLEEGEARGGVEGYGRVVWTSLSEILKS